METTRSRLVNDYSVSEYLVRWSQFGDFFQRNIRAHHAQQFASTRLRTTKL